MENRWHARVFHVAARSFAFQIGITLISSVLLCRAFLPLPFSRKETRERGTFLGRFRFLRWWILHSRARKRLLRVSRASVWLKSGGTSRMVHRFNVDDSWCELFRVRGRIAVGWNLFQRDVQSFSLSLGYSLVSFRPENGVGRDTQMRRRVSCSGNT